MECYRGSVSHNLYIKPEDKFGTDDIDLLNVYHYPKAYYFTLEGYNRKREVYEEWDREFDIVGYEIRKFMKMLADLNPNVISTLYLKKKHYMKTTKAWNHILANRNVFVGKDKIKVVYSGYAHSQIKKMEAFSKQGYMGDKRERLVKKFGYDTKNASHCIRLLKMGIEFVSTGEPVVYRIKDREELLDIKRGKLSLEEVKDYAKDLKEKFSVAHEKSDLPKEVNIVNVNKLLFDVMELVL